MRLFVSLCLCCCILGSAWSYGIVRTITRAGVSTIGHLDTRRSRNRPLFRHVKRRLIPVSVSTTIGGFSAIEIYKGLGEVGQEVRLGHAHGTVLLALLRLVRSTTTLQTNVEELHEEVHEFLLETQQQQPGQRLCRCVIRRLVRPLQKVIVSPITALIICTLAMGCAAAEIYQDLQPGAHHGAALLAVAEANYQRMRFGKVKTALHIRKQGGAVVTSAAVAVVSAKQQIPYLVWWNRLRSRLSVGATTFVAAAVFAAAEIVQDLRPGAHHGVAILAVAELLENVQRRGAYVRHKKGKQHKGQQQEQQQPPRQLQKQDKEK